MSPFLFAVEAAGHYAAALPLVMCFVLWAMRRNPEPYAWLLAATFAVSFVADGVGGQLRSQGLSNWWLGYIYAPIQFGLFVAILARDPVVRRVAVRGVLLLGVVSVLIGRVGEPETFVQVVGGILAGILIVAARITAPDLVKYRAVVLVYCVAAVPWVVGMAAISFDSPWWDAAWVPYELTRVVALGLMTWTLLRKEVPSGPQIYPDLRQRRVGLRDIGGGHRPVVEATQR